MASAPGWYPDPKPGVQGLRWWDGSRWTDYVAPHTAQPPPAPNTADQYQRQQQQHAYQYQPPPQQQQPPEKPRRIRKAGKRISWLAFATFVVLVGVIGYALTRQDVEYVDLKVGKVGFIGTERVEVAKVEESSDELKRRVEQLEAEAQNKAVANNQTVAGGSSNNDSDNDTSADTDIDLTGNWSGANDFSYRIEQFGNEVVVSEIHPLYGTTGVGNGTFDGDTLSMNFVVADGSTGHAELRLDGPNRLEGTFENYGSGARITAVLTRANGP